ncbi:hypothetical protein [Pseudonocardia sp. WMMC193]|uniref:hypothetical protein n=1 Tax=Pseudonocardia sp. WMMC193 TaxID=2911965 RepID=UPI001F2DCDF9|nr:hypothetical protein [Pseudonocardia sp. WMMC193]MCF7552216.1 hypothetical protein [Pseudonocardia sp. WMMC193]
MSKSREEMDRHNARRRAKTKAARADISDEIEVLYGKPIEDWDDEELVRGRPRDRSGRFLGRRPAWLTPALQAERQRRLRQLMADDLGTFAADALRTIHSVMMDDSRDDEGKPRVPASVRVDAGKYLVDQFMGKATATVDVHAGSQLGELLSGILVNPDGEPSHQIIEGEVVADPSEGDDQPDHMPRRIES